MNPPVEFALRNRGLVVVSLLAVLGLGIHAYRQLDVEAFPDISPIMVPVFSEAEGLAPEEVEQLIAYPIESAMNGLPGVTLVKSTSAFGLAVVYVYFTQDTDIYFARQVVAERLNAALAELPDLRRPPTLGPISTGLGQVFLYYLTLEEGADTGDLDELTYLRDVNDWLVKRQLKTVPGVTDILTAGGHVLQYQIRLDPYLLHQYRLSLADVVDAVQAHNRNVGGQYLTLGAEEHLVRGIGLLRTVEDIRGVTVKTFDGTPVTVADVGDVDYGPELRRGVVTLGAEREVVSGIVMKLYGANSSRVIQDLYEKVGHVQAGLPQGVRLVPYYEQADLVSRATRTVTLALAQGMALVVFVLFAFLGSLRAAAIVALAIPFCAAVAVIGMRGFGISANLMSLGGIAIALGLLVDGSIVVTENIHRFLGGQPPGSGSRHDRIAAATREVGRPIAFAILIVITVFLPILSLQGVEGLMFRPLAYTVMLALAGSLWFALLGAPALSSFVLRSAPYRESAFFRALKVLYRRALSGALRVKPLFYLAVAALVAGSILGLRRIGTEFIPVLEEGSILLSVIMAPSVSLEEAERTIHRVSREIEAVPGIDEFVARIGRPEAGSHPHPVNFAEIHIELEPDADKPSVIAALRARLEAYPGIQINVAQPIQQQFDELLSGVRAQVAIKVYGEELDVIRSAAEAIRRALEPVEGITDLAVEQSYGQPQVRVILNHEALSRYGVAGETVLELVETAVGGQVIGTLYRNIRRYGIHLRYAPEFRSTPEQLRALFIRSADGALLRIDQLADIQRVEGPLQINREHNQRRWIVQMNVDGRALGDVLEDVRAAIAGAVDLPPGVFLEYGGQFEQQQAAMHRLSIIVPLVILSIFILLWIAFRAVRYAAIILLNVPLALIGGVFGLWATGHYLSVPASIGFIALFGIAMQDAMVLVTDFNDLRREGKSVRDAVIEGGLIRFRPVLMTTLTTLLGLLPLLVSTGAGAEVQRPLAAVVVCGLLTSTFLTLFVLPAVYESVEGRGRA